MAKFTWRATDRIWVATHLAQEIHPRTGAPWLYEEPDRKPTIWPVDKLVEELASTLTPVTDTVYVIAQFVAKADGKLITDGLAEYGLALSDIQADLETAQRVKTEFLEDQKFILDKTALASLGDEKTVTDWQTDKSPIVLIKMKAQDRLCNCAHDALDVLAYELRGRSPYTGNLINYELKHLETLIIERCKVARIEARACGHPDAAGILAICDWIDANRQAKFADIAGYIESHIQRLPLVRRHWAL